MKKNIILFLFLLPCFLQAQKVNLVKGGITENIVINDSIKESFSVYIPSYFDVTKNWPIVFVLDMEGKSKQSLLMFRDAAEQQGYILATSNSTSDSLSLSKNILIANRFFNAAYDLLPLHKERTYTAGFSDAARFASIIPNFIKGIKGVISCGAAVGSMDILSPKNSFYFVGIVGREDYNYIDMLATRKVLDRLKFPNQLLLFDGGHDWPTTDLIANALEILTLSSMAKGEVPKDEEMMAATYKKSLTEANKLFSDKKPLLAEHKLSEMIRVYGPWIEMDSLRDIRKQLRRSGSFKANKRNQNNVMVKESFSKEDYVYFLEEDVMTYNYNNLGWWNYQMDELDKLAKSSNVYEKQMSHRLRGYLNALIEDTIDMVAGEKMLDMEALTFLYMLKTISEPENFTYYLNVISNSAKVEDYGTSLFYLEELLKNGYKNKDELYAVEHTALLRITPEFNALVEKYLNTARYGIMED
ncbi:alpha/beta hydrolase [Maribacter chungangensis]|uniref:Alpha/beta hydrolase n=1 Tax=Maribacter chungangensis TaxID=1069117 RepID=A0ABW3B1A9_9FLAO